jgi:hypothetical protein
MSELTKQPIYGELNRQHKILAGVIRNKGTGWSYIEDVGHAPINMNAVSVNSNGSIRVDHTPDAIKVGTLVATPDETFSNDGLICGASVGMTYSLIDLHFPLNVVVNGDGTFTLPTYFGSTVTGYLSTDKSEIVINHPKVNPSDIPQVISPISGGENAHYAVSYTDTQVIVRLLKDLAGHIYYDGTQFKYLGANVNNFSFSFDNSTGELTVSHDQIGSSNAYSVTLNKRDGYHEPILTGPLTNSFKVKFYDSAGNVVLTPDTSMRMYFSRPNAKYKSPLSSTSKVLVKRDHCKANANNVVNTGANIWIHGLMEL